MTQRRDLQALIDAAPVGKMQWRVIICCFLVVMLDGFDTAAIGFIAPDIRTHWQLSRQRTCAAVWRRAAGAYGRRAAMRAAGGSLWPQAGH